MANIELLLEDLHWDFKALSEEIENHGWSKRMTRYDSDFLNTMRRKFMKYSNKFYEIREASKAN